MFRLILVLSESENQFLRINVYNIFSVLSIVDT